MPNYTGSVGYGQDNVYSLGGNIGDYDIADCLAALDHFLNKSEKTYDNVFVFGGSHGGFLTAHLTAARPDQFRAAVIRFEKTWLVWDFNMIPEILSSTWTACITWQTFLIGMSGKGWIFHRWWENHLRKNKSWNCEKGRQSPMRTK